MNRLMNAALWRCSVSDRPLELFFFCTSFLFLCIFSLEPSVLWTFTVLLDLPQFCVFQSELWTQFCTCQLFNGPNRKETSSCDLDAVIMLWSDYRSVINTSSWMLMQDINSVWTLCVCRLAHVSAALPPDLFSHWKHKTRLFIFWLVNDKQELFSACGFKSSVCV